MRGLCMWYRAFWLPKERRFQSWNVYKLNRAVIFLWPFFLHLPRLCQRVQLRRDVWLPSSTRSHLVFQCSSISATVAARVAKSQKCYTEQIFQNQRKPLEARIIETWTPNSTGQCRPWTLGRWVWLTYGDLAYQWLTSIQTWTPRSVFCRPQSLGLWVSASGTDHESMVHVLRLQLWGEVRGHEPEAHGLYPKLRLTDLGIEVCRIQT